MRIPGVTLLLILANAAVLGWAVQQGGGLAAAFTDGNPVVARLIKVNALVAGGEWYRLASCMFLHLSVIHILMNMFVLWDLGRLAEAVWGRFGFLLIYLSSGLAGSLASFAFVANPSAGASGAVFGIAGALLSARFLAHDREMPFPKQSLGYIAGFVAYNIVIGSSSPGIDNAAHLGGLAAGAALGFAFLPSRNILLRVVLMGGVAAGGWLLYQKGMGL